MKIGFIGLSIRADNPLGERQARYLLPNVLAIAARCGLESEF